MCAVTLRTACLVTTIFLSFSIAGADETNLLIEPAVDTVVIADSRIALDLLTTRDPSAAGELALACDRANRKRQRIKRGVTTRPETRWSARRMRPSGSWPARGGTRR